MFQDTPEEEGPDDCICNPNSASADVALLCKHTSEMRIQSGAVRHDCNFQPLFQPGLDILHIMGTCTIFLSCRVKGKRSGHTFAIKLLSSRVWDCFAIEGMYRVTIAMKIELRILVSVQNLVFEKDSEVAKGF